MTLSSMRSFFNTTQLNGDMMAWYNAILEFLIINEKCQSREECSSKWNHFGICHRQSCPFNLTECQTSDSLHTIHKQTIILSVCDQKIKRQQSRFLSSHSSHKNTTSSINAIITCAYWNTSETLQKHISIIIFSQFPHVWCWSLFHSTKSQ